MKRTIKKHLEFCMNCGSEIEFSTSEIGIKISCQKCGKEIELKMPKEFVVEISKLDKENALLEKSYEKSNSDWLKIRNPDDLQPEELINLLTEAGQIELAKIIKNVISASATGGEATAGILYYLDTVPFEELAESSKNKLWNYYKLLKSRS